MFGTQGDLMAIANPLSWGNNSNESNTKTRIYLWTNSYIRLGCGDIEMQQRRMVVN